MRATTTTSGQAERWDLLGPLVQARSASPRLQRAMTLLAIVAAAFGCWAAWRVVTSGFLLGTSPTVPEAALPLVALVMTLPSALVLIGLWMDFAKMRWRAGFVLAGAAFMFAVGVLGAVSPVYSRTDFLLHGLPVEPGWSKWRADWVATQSAILWSYVACGAAVGVCFWVQWRRVNRRRKELESGRIA